MYGVSLLRERKLGISQHAFDFAGEEHLRFLDDTSAIGHDQTELLQIETAFQVVAGLAGVNDVGGRTGAVSTLGNDMVSSLHFATKRFAAVKTGVRRLCISSDGFLRFYQHKSEFECGS